MQHFRGLVSFSLFLTFLLSFPLRTFAGDEALLPYLIIHSEDREPTYAKLSPSFEIANAGDCLEVYSENLKEVIDISSITSLGILYMKDEPSSSLSPTQDESDNPIFIYDLNGNLIRETSSANPDLSGLSPGRIYIIKSGATSYKYLPYK